MKFKRSSDEQVQFLRQSAQLEESPAPYAVQSMAVVLSLLTILFLAWTVFAEVEEVAHAPGEVVPVGFPQTVQHYDGGVVAKIFVQEDSFVQKDDVLLRLDGTGTHEDLNKANIVYEGMLRKRKTAEQLFFIQEKLRASGVASEGRYLEVRQALNDAASAVEQQKEIVAQLQARVNRLEIRAPATGYVKGLRINTVGAVVKSGEPLMDIVPTDRPLVVEARIAPSDIGQIKKGQPVRIKVSAYDYARYGTLDGKLAFITATTFEDKDGRRFYRARIELDREHMGKDSRAKLQSGMTVQVGILTGKKTVFAYLFKPIHRALENGFSER